MIRGRLLVVVLALSLCISCVATVEPAPEPVVRPVKIYRVSEAGGRIPVEYPARVDPFLRVELAFQIPGRIVEMNFIEGQEVKRGDLLARLDSADQRAALAAEEARLALAEAEYDRMLRLFQSDSVSRKEYDVARARLDVQRATVRIAAKALEDTRLVANFDGVITRQLVTDYRTIAAGETIALLEDQSALKVIADVPEADAALATPGLSLEERTAQTLPLVELSSLPGMRYQARIVEFAGAADPQTRTFRATLAIDPVEGLNVRPGMTARLILTRVFRDAGEGVMVPVNAVLADSEARPCVWVLDPKQMTASRRRVTVGAVTEGRIQVVEGLDAGDLVAVSGVHQLRAGMQVRPLEDPP